MSITTTKPETAGTELASYRAAVVHEFSAPLEIEKVPRPALEPERILVKVEACGLSHTDIHAAHGDWPVKPSPPFISRSRGRRDRHRAGAGRHRGRPR